jgi:hypothetical protein
MGAPIENTEEVGGAALKGGCLRREEIEGAKAGLPGGGETSYYSGVGIPEQVPPPTITKPNEMPSIKGAGSQERGRRGRIQGSKIDGHELNRRLKLDGGGGEI